MTRINLLSREVIARRKAKKWIILGFVAAAGVVFLLFVVYTAQVTRLGLLKAEIAKLDEKIAEYRELDEKLTRVRKEKEIVIKRLNAIKTLLEKDRFLWCHLLEEMSKCLPDGLWLKSMGDAGGDALSISATSIDNFAVASFMINLKENPYFDEVELLTLHKTKIRDQDVRAFRLRCKYVRG